MTILHISDGDIEAIEKFIAIGRDKFNLTINIEKDIDNIQMKKIKPLSLSLDKKLRALKVTNIQRASKLSKARKELNNLLNPSKNNIKITNSNSSKRLEKALNFLNEHFKDNGEIPFEKAREEYLTNKYNV